jgi:hypothetical protein
LGGFVTVSVVKASGLSVCLHRCFRVIGLWRAASFVFMLITLKLVIHFFDPSVCANVAAKEKETNSLRSELAMLRAEHTALQVQARRAYDGRDKTLQMLDEFVPEIKVRYRRYRDSRALISQARPSHVKKKKRIVNNPIELMIVSSPCPIRFDEQKRDAAAKFGELRRRVQEALPALQSADAFDAYLDQSFAASATAAPATAPSSTKKGASLSLQS